MKQSIFTILENKALTRDVYKMVLEGDTSAITAAFPHVPNLEIRDRTVPEIDLWSNMGEDTLEGVYFRMLHDAMTDGSEKLQQHIKLAARISRQILDGQEVTLP